MIGIIYTGIKVVMGVSLIGAGYYTAKAIATEEEEEIIKTKNILKYEYIKKKKVNTDKKDIDYELKDILEIIDEHPVINEEMMEIGKYISKKTLSTLICAFIGKTFDIFQILLYAIFTKIFYLISVFCIDCIVFVA